MNLKQELQTFCTPWYMPTADRAYRVIVAAGAGDKNAKKLIDEIKKLAAAGNASAQYAKRMFDVVAIFVLRGLNAPSQVSAKLRQAQAARSKVRSVAAAAAQKSLLQNSMRQARLGQRKQQNFLRAKIDLLERELERRDMSEEQRRQLEDQRDQYQNQIDQLSLDYQQQIEALRQVAPAGASPVVATPEQAVDAAEEASSPLAPPAAPPNAIPGEGPDGEDTAGAPGDVEFSS